MQFRFMQELSFLEDEPRSLKTRNLANCRKTITTATLVAKKCRAACDPTPSPIKDARSYVIRYHKNEKCIRPLWTKGKMSRK